MRPLNKNGPFDFVMKKCAAILLSFFWFVPLIAPHTTSEGVMVAVIIPVEAEY